MKEAGVSMFRNYIDIALRGFLGNKLFSFINVFGLAVGLASVILIGLYVANELSYDRFHPDADRLYRISRDFYAVNGSDELLMATNAAPAAALLAADFPEIEETARIFGGRVLLGRDDVAFYDDGVRFADPSITRLFAFEWLSGDAATALAEPNSVVLTESAARKYFGNTDPLGQTLRMENSMDLAVTGVIRDLPHNTHLYANVLISIETVLRAFGEAARSAWAGNSYHTYVKLAPGADIEAIAARFPDFMNRHIEAEASLWTGMVATKVTDIHLHTDRQFEMQPQGSMATVISLITVAAGILIIACFNFMNLATARSALRSKEVGVRKTIGAERSHLIMQFLGESVGLTLISTLIAVVLVELALPAFGAFTGASLAFDLFGDPALQLGLVALVLVVGCAAGAYPALYLSAFKPAQVMKQRAAVGLGDVLFRNLLVVLQFSISIVLLVATSVVLLQTRYARELDPGFEREQVVVLTGPPSQGLTGRWETLREELLAHADIVSVTASNLLPGQENLNSFGVRPVGQEQMRDMPFQFVDVDFFETYEVPLVAGRTFSREFPNDRVDLPSLPDSETDGNFLLNEAAVRDFGWTIDDAIGQEFEIGTGAGLSMRGRIVGVVADSKFESVRFSVKPLVFIHAPSGMWMNQFPTLASASVRISGRNMADTLAFIDATWARVIPEYPIERSFLSDSFDALYQDDTRLGQLFSSFAALAVVIACLGLFGLATFNTQRRIKEIGVRKVLGGSAWSIVVLLTGDFSRLVLISNLIAWPVAYFAMERWLQNFAYRIDLTPLVFIGSGLIALCIAWVTVGGTAAKAAAQKPVLALRYE
jgi:putative ABC transport system permease protein